MLRNEPANEKCTVSSIQNDSFAFLRCLDASRAVADYHREVNNQLRANLAFPTSSINMNAVGLR